MGLMTLPALWVGRDASTVLQLMAESVERLVRLDVCYVNVDAGPDEPAVVSLRVAGRATADSEKAGWAELLPALAKLPIGSAAVPMETPHGVLRFIRLSMGYSAKGGSVWFAAREPDFPSTNQSAFLRTAATLAATGLQLARIDRERERASRVKDEFLAMLGHELRNPLAPIFGSLELIKRQSTGPLSAPHGVIERQAKHLSRLVDDLLDVSRIAGGKLELHKKIVDLNPLVRHAVESVASLLEQRQHGLSVRLPDAPAFVFGDPTRLTQIISNLLTNAIKYTPVQGQVWLEVRCDEHNAFISVRDSGPGISPELRPRLFHIFEQGVNHHDSSGGGLGVGLSLVKSFAERHDGTVDLVDRVPGQGAEFIVTLPLRNDETAGENSPFRPAHADAQVPAPDVRVLVIDDNVDAATSTAEILEMCGMAVATAFNPEDGLQQLESFAPTVVLMDIGLPNMSGHELAVEIRQRWGSRTPRLIALSGYGQPSDHRKSLAAGFERHLVKPVDFDELLVALGAQLK